MAGSDPNLVNHLLREDIKDPATGEVIYKAETRVTAEMATKIRELGLKSVLVRPYVSDEYEYLSADAKISMLLRKQMLL